MWITNRASKVNTIYFQIWDSIIGKRKRSEHKAFLSLSTPRPFFIKLRAEFWLKKVPDHIKLRFQRKVIGKSRRDRTRNKRIREELKICPIRIVWTRLPLGTPKRHYGPWWNHWTGSPVISTWVTSAALGDVC